MKRHFALFNATTTPAIGHAARLASCRCVWDEANLIRAVLP
ncbi:hypothetical protein [uncultured Thiodictyon sp.]|nr:hypothetical protein [uncultured Thiodictyon sp.]